MFQTVWTSSEQACFYTECKWVQEKKVVTLCRGWEVGVISTFHDCLPESKVVSLSNYRSSNHLFVCQCSVFNRGEIFIYNAVAQFIV